MHLEPRFVAKKRFFQQNTIWHIRRPDHPYEHFRKLFHGHGICSFLGEARSSLLAQYRDLRRGELLEGEAMFTALRDLAVFSMLRLGRGADDRYTSLFLFSGFFETLAMKRGRRTKLHCETSTA